MATSTTKTNKPINPRGNDQSPLAFNRAKLYSGKALDFDGVNDYLTFDGFAGTLSNNDAWTACGYFKSNKTTGRGTWFSAHNNSGGNIIRVWLEPAPDNNGIWFSDITTGDVQIGSYDVNDDHWYHIALSRPQGGNSTEVTLYINGVASGTLGTGTDWNNADLFSLGQEYDGGPSPSDYFDGQMSGFKIFNTALTAAQVADLYNNPEKVVPTGVDNTALKLWLPMMEGAGTTAYDGSGNGNHGTISGATYVHGVGAPVAQSAVIDWNKGSNYAVYSEEFENADWSKFTGASVDSNETTAPDGKTTADKVSFSASASSRISDTYTTSTSNNKTHTVSVWAKVASGTEKFRLKCTHSGVADYFSSDFTVTTEWQRFTFSQAFGGTAGSGIIYAIQNATDGAARDIFFWGFQLDFDSSTAGPYVRTGATAQTSPVLLPQGLTSGRDITGVNLFENVRKQGALNLDGKSWAEVHDNASLDFGTGSFTLEAWAKVKFVNAGSSYNAILTLGGNAADDTSLSITNSLETRFEYAGDSSSVSSSTEGDWVHLVGTYDETNATFYINGSQADQDARTAVDITNALVKHIGRDSTSIRFYNDQIAQPRIYNRALTAEEVERNYNAGKNTYKN